MTRRWIRVMNTAFRDGFQSVYGARVFTRDFLPAVEACRAAGLTHYEAGGGARFHRRHLEAAGLPVTDENIFIAATCGDKSIVFLQGRAKTGVRKLEPERAATPDGGGYTVTVDGVPYAVVLEKGHVTVDGRDYTVDVRDGIDEASAMTSGRGGAAARGIAIEAKNPGTVVKIPAAAGATVAAGDTVVVLEAMKMEFAVRAPQAGTVAARLRGHRASLADGPANSATS